MHLATHLILKLSFRNPEASLHRAKVINRDLDISVQPAIPLMSNILKRYFIVAPGSLKL